MPPPPTSTPPLPTPESLFLSASQFTSSINSWIPSSFAPPKSEAQLNREFQKALETAARDGEHERLGLGHPGLDVPRLAGFGALSKRLGIKGKGKGKGKAEEEGDDGVGQVGQGGEVDDDDEEEEGSRVKSLGKGKKRSNAFDPLAPKKKVKIKPPTTSLDDTIGPQAGESSDYVNGKADIGVASKTLPTQPFHSSFDTSTTLAVSPIQKPGTTEPSFNAPALPRQKSLNSSSTTPHSGNILLLDPKSTTPDSIADEEDSPLHASQSGDKPSRTQRRREARRLARLKGGEKDSQSGSQQ